MGTDSIYPNLPEGSDDLTGTKLHELTEGQLSRSRASEIINKRKELEKECNHYKKVRRKYKTASNILSGLGIGIGGTLALAGVVIGGLSTAGIAIPLLVPTILAGVGAFEATLSGTIAFTYLKRRIHRFSEKYELVSTYLNSLYHLYHRSIEDARITVDEMDEFYNLVKDYETEMSKLNTHKNTNDHHLTKLQHQAKAEAKKEYDAKLLVRLRDDELKELEKSFRQKAD